ncbi:hypothetical protein [Clostridium sp. YIM B02569]|uniref:hypothetical protein n=1 Tax=Clostridium sp. YIM B02569 TaxID=2911967 RepID=UPI001EE9DE36|nr:hypothetical protein [Clostridium sp. YIM B02569]
MKERLKIIYITFAVIFSIFILCYVGFLAPYNLKELININIQSFSKDHAGVLSEYFENYTVSKVKYLGNKSYEVFTDKGDFIVIADYSDNNFWKYKIFKYEDEYQYFSNRM